MLYLSSGESRVMRGRGREESFDLASSIDFRDASPVADTTDPPQAEGDMMRGGKHAVSLLWRVARYTSGEAVRSRLI